MSHPKQTSRDEQIVIRRAGLYRSEDIRRPLFAGRPKRRTLGTEQRPAEAYRATGVRAVDAKRVARLLAREAQQL